MCVVVDRERVQSETALKHYVREYERCDYISHDTSFTKRHTT